jgi:hypothetical protein
MASELNDPSDDAIDAAVRDVPLPEGLAVRATAEVLFSDTALDGLVRAVSVPPEVVERLRTALQHPRAGRHGVDLDRLAAVVGQSSPGAAGGAVVRGPDAASRRRPGRLRRWGVTLARDVAAVAASLACLVAVFFAGMQVSDWLAMEGEPSPRQTSSSASRDAGRGGLTAAPGRGGSVPAATAAPDALPAASVVERTQPADTSVARGDAAVDVVPASPTVLGAVDIAGRDGAAEMRLVSALPTSRRRVPRVPGFDLGFEIRHGEAPFVDPATAPTLSVDEPPLSTLTDSFDAALDMIRAGRRPSPGMVRAEHVVAAMTVDRRPYEAGRRPAAAVTVHAVQSLRRSPASMFVEVAVTASSFREGDRPPLDAVIVLDRSVGTCGPATWRSVCRALGAVADQMRPDDRVTLIDAASDPRVVVDAGDAQALREAGLVIRDLPAVRAADVDAAFRLRAEHRRSAGPWVVVSTRDSLERARDEAAASFLAWRRGAAEHDRDETGDDSTRVAFVVVDAMRGESATPATVLRGHVAPESRSIRIGLLEALFRQPAVVLRECRLAVEMNPGGVALYRIVGHRHSAVDSVSGGGPQPVDLHAGETARVVYEVVPRAAAAGETRWLVRARLRARPAAVPGGAPVSGEAVLLSTDVEPASPIPSPQACETILAVEVAEWLSGSPHAASSRRDSRGFAEMLAAWRSRGNVTPFGAEGMAFWERGRSGSRGKAPPFDAQ